MELKNELIQFIRICIKDRFHYLSILKTTQKALGEWFCFCQLHALTSQNCSKMQKNPQLYDFPLRIFLKAQCKQVKKNLKKVSCPRALRNIGWLCQTEYFTKIAVMKSAPLIIMFNLIYIGANDQRSEDK